MAHHGHIWTCTYNYGTAMSRLKNMSWSTTALWGGSSKPAIHFLVYQDLGVARDKKKAMLTKHHYYTVYSCLFLFSSTILYPPLKGARAKYMTHQQIGFLTRGSCSQYMMKKKWNQHFTILPITHIGSKREGTTYRRTYSSGSFVIIGPLRIAAIASIVAICTQRYIYPKIQ